MTDYDLCASSADGKHCLCWWNMATCCRCRPIASLNGASCDCACAPHERDHMLYQWMQSDKSQVENRSVRSSMGVTDPPLPEIGSVCATLGDKNFVWHGVEWVLRDPFHFGAIPLYDCPVLGDVWWNNQTGTILYFDGVKWRDAFAEAGAACCAGWEGTSGHSVGCPCAQPSSEPRLPLPEPDASKASKVWREMLRLDPNCDPFVAHDPQPSVSNVVMAASRCKPFAAERSGTLSFSLKSASSDLINLLFGGNPHPTVEVPTALLESVLEAIKTLSGSQGAIGAILADRHGDA